MPTEVKALLFYIPCLVIIWGLLATSRRGPPKK